MKNFVLLILSTFIGEWLWDRYETSKRNAGN